VRLSGNEWVTVVGLLLVGLIPFAVLGILLGHLRLALTLAEDKRFELLRGCPQHAFQACALGH
jgi:hypothetical protein